MSEETSKALVKGSVGWPNVELMPDIRIVPGSETGVPALFVVLATNESFAVSSADDDCGLADGTNVTVMSQVLGRGGVFSPKAAPVGCKVAPLQVPSDT